MAESSEILQHLSTVQGVPYFDFCNSNVSWCEPFQLKHPIIEPIEIFQPRPIQLYLCFPDIIQMSQVMRQSKQNLWRLTESFEIIQQLSKMQGLPYLHFFNSVVSYYEPFQLKHWKL